MHFTLAAVWVACFGAWIRLEVGGAWGTRTFDDVATTLTAVAAGVSCARAARGFAGRRRASWSLLAASGLLWGAGNGVWTVYELVNGTKPPGASLADVGYLSGALAAAAGMLLLPAPRRAPLAARAAVDGLIVGGVLFAVSWSLVGQALLRQPAVDPLTNAINLAYPVLDVVIISAAAYAALHSSSWAHPIIGTMAAGWACNAVADSAFAYLSAAGTYTTGAWSDAFWVAGFALVWVAGRLASQQSWPDPVPARRTTLSSIIVYGLIALAVGLRIAHPLPARTLVLDVDAFAVFSLLIVRQILGAIDNGRLDRERNQALEALAASEAQLQQLVSNAPVVLFALDAAGTFTAAKGQGVPNVEEAVGFNLKDIGPEHPLLPLFKRAVAGSEASGQMTLRDRLLDVTCQPLYEDGRITGVVGVAIDITDRHAAVVARRESEAKDRFLANMSHELRTPLNSILGFAQMLDAEATGTLNEKQLRYRGHILTSGRQLLELINEVLDLAKVSSGRLEVSLQPVSLEPVVLEAMATVRPQVDAGSLHLEAAPMKGVVVSADAGRLRQVLLNLLSNAIKFTAEGGRVQVSAVVAGDAVLLRVSDTGVGIAEADQARIFDEFTQLDPGRSRSVQGTGLGLPLSRALVRRMGGDIEVASEPGRGSTFTVRLLRASAVAGDLAHQLGEAPDAFAKVGFGAGQADPDGASRHSAESGARRHRHAAFSQKAQGEVPGA